VPPSGTIGRFAGESREIAILSADIRVAAAIVVAGVMFSTQCRAWGPLGYPVITHIAATELAPTARTQVEQLLGSPAEDVLLGTLWTKASPELAGGELRGCMLEYAVLARDFVYKHGTLIHIGGSIGVWTANRNIATTLKVVVHDIDPRTAAFTPSAPKSAYFVSGSETTKDAVIRVIESNFPGRFTELLNVDRTLKIILQGISHGNITIAFARTTNGSSVQFSVDSSVVETSANGTRTKSPAAADEFLKCNQALVEGLERSVN
jgi:hypothetical protein